MQVFDASDPSALVYISSTSLGIIPWAVLAGGDLAYVTGDSISSIDVSDLAYPAVLDQHSDVSGRIVETDGDMLFGAEPSSTRASDVILIDGADPSDLSAISSYTPITGYGGVSDILADGDVMFLAVDGIEAVDVSDPSAPTLIASIEKTQWYLESIALEGDYLFATEEERLSTYQVYQRTRDLHRTVVQSTDIEPNGGTLVRARLTTVQTGEIEWSLSPDGGATWYEIEPDNSWVEFDPDTGSELIWRAEFVYRGGVGPSCTSLSIEYEAEGAGVDDELPTRFALHQNSPNPFNPVTTVEYDVPAPGGRVTVAVYDVSGRLVRTLVDSPQEPGSLAAVWDGTDERGAHVGSGVYYCRMQASGFDERIKLTLLK
jgi:hypothetical protein